MKQMGWLFGRHFTQIIGEEEILKEHEE